MPQPRAETAPLSAFMAATACIVHGVRAAHLRVTSRRDSFGVKFDTRSSSVSPVSSSLDHVPPRRRRAAVARQAVTAPSPRPARVATGLSKRRRAQATSQLEGKRRKRAPARRQACTAQRTHRRPLGTGPAPPRPSRARARSAARPLMSPLMPLISPLIWREQVRG